MFWKLAFVTLIAFLVLGCTSTPDGTHCQTDADCPENYCSGDLTRFVNYSCFMGICNSVLSECNETAVCIQGTGCAQLEISSFEECASAGFPVMESYPRQCVAYGKTFVENITLGEYLE